MELIKVLQRRDIVLFWLGQVVSAIGDRFFDFAVVWIATEQIGADAGFVILAGTAASLAFGLFGGVFADRWNRRTIMIATDLTRASVLAVVVLVSVSGGLQLWHLAVAMAILSGLNSLFEPTLYASLPALVQEPRALQATNALFDVTWRVSTAVAPAIAGYVLALLPVSRLFAADALTFLLSAIALVAISGRYAWQPERPERISGGLVRDVFADLNDGVQTVWNHPPLRWALIISFIIGSMVWGVVFVVGVPLFAATVLNGDSTTFGWIGAAYGVGNVLSNLVIGNLLIRRRMLVLFGGGVLLASGFVLLAASTSLWLAMVGAFIASIGGPMEDIMILLIMQDELPPGKIGKVYGIRMVTGEIGFGVGLALATVLYELVPVPVGMIGVALVQLVAGLLGIAMFGRLVVGSSVEPEPTL